MPSDGRPFPRVRALITAAADAGKRGSFARTFDAALDTHLITREVLGDHEVDLACLDDEPWQSLMAAAVPRLYQTKNRGWDPVFDLLNEVKGYIYLKSMQCEDIAFVTPTYERKSPDLRAILNGRPVLCEVKTISTSDGAAPADAFFSGKFRRMIAEAQAQLDAFSDGDCRKIIFIVLRFGEILNEATAAQLDACLKQASADLDEVEVKVFANGKFDPGTI